MRQSWILLTILALLPIGLGRALGAEAAELRVSIGDRASLPTADRASLDLALEDQR